MGREVHRAVQGHVCLRPLWDEKAQRLLKARDRVGKKPLYYAEDKGRFLFGSEIKAILQAPGVSREIDLAALSDYLSHLYVPSPRTIFSAISKLPAAHYAVVTKDRFDLHPYWDISFEPREDRSEAQIIEDLLGILDESTRLRMISDVPLGAFLSGGVDSSAVVALMAHASREPAVTNSISFSSRNPCENWDRPPEHSLMRPGGSLLSGRAL